MKSGVAYWYRYSDESLPVRGAWIEIFVLRADNPGISSLPVRGAWIEIYYWLFCYVRRGSLPVRGAWIEIEKEGVNMPIGGVAPRKGSVD